HDVGLAVAVSIFGVENIGRCAHERAFAPGHHTSRKRNCVQEQRGFVKSSIAVDVLQKFYPTTWFAFAVETRGIIVHFADPELAVGREINGYGINHQRLTSSELDFQIGSSAKRSKGFGRTFRWRKLGFFRIEKKLLWH